MYSVLIQRGSELGGTAIHVTLHLVTRVLEYTDKNNMKTEKQAWRDKRILLLK